jgi:zinc transporter
MNSRATPADEATIDIDLSAVPDSNNLGVVPGLVWAIRVHDNGAPEVLPIEAPIRHEPGGWLWLHFNLADAEARAWLSKAELPPAAIALLLSRDRHQQLHATRTCVYGLFADFSLRLEQPTDEVVHLRFAMTERLLVSGRHHPLAAVQAAREAIERGERRPSRVAALLELIIDHVADAIDGVADDLAEQLDSIEDGLTRGSSGDHRQVLGSLRRTGVQLHRRLSGLRALFHRFEREGPEGLEPPLRIETAKLAQRLDALDHRIVEMRDRARLLHEEITIAQGEEMNRHLHTLSIITTLFLPPTLVTGIFGMNTKGLPLTDVEDGFLWAMALLVGSSGAVYLLLRRFGLLK